MDDICCTSCGYVAQYEDVSDGDFDVENSMCYPCSVAEEEKDDQDIGGYTHTTDERRFATPMTFSPFCDTDAIDNGSIHDWADVMGDGMPVNLRTLTQGADPEVYNENERVNTALCANRRMLRAIDMLGPNRVQRHLGTSWVPGNVGMQPVEPGGLVKGALTTSPIMCGGGGGSGGTM